MEKEYVFIVDVENFWFDNGERVNRDCPKHRIFKEESLATDFITKVWDSIKTDEESTLETMFDNEGLVSAKINYNAGYDSIADCETKIEVKVQKCLIDKELDEDPWETILGEIYVG